MTTVLELAEDSARYAAEAEFGALLQAHDFERLEARLSEILAALPARLSALCLSMSPDQVEVVGWDEVNVRIEMLSHVKPITAVVVNLSPHAEYVRPDGLREQGLETSYHSDASDFAFSTSTDREIVRDIRKWQGSGDDIGNAVEVRGLTELYTALLDYELTYQSPALERVNVWAAQWWRHLRVHRAIALSLTTAPLARDLPVVVGAHDEAPYVEAVYRATHIADVRAAAEQRQLERDQANKAHRAAHTEKVIVEWREQRDTVRRMRRQPDSRQRTAYIDLVEAEQALQLLGTPMQDSAPMYEMNDDAFERLLAGYRHYRDPSASPSVIPKPTGLASLGRVFGFGRKGS